MYVFFISYLIRLPLMGSTEANRWIYVHTMEWKMGNFIWTNRENGRFLLCVFFCCCCFYCWLLAARCTENKFIYKQCMINDFLGFFSVSSANLVPARMQQESDMAWTIYVPAFDSYVFFRCCCCFWFFYVLADPSIYRYIIIMILAGAKEQIYDHVNEIWRWYTYLPI